MKKVPVRHLCECALLIALQIVLNRFASFQLLGVKFGLSFLPMALCAMRFGPWWAAGCYALSDVIGYLLYPTGPYFPGFSLTCALMGVCYGLFLYKREKLRLFPDVLVPSVINTMILGLFLNTLWMTMLYSSRGFSGWLLYRLPQEVGLLVLHILLLPLVQKLADALRKGGLVT